MDNIFDINEISEIVNLELTSTNANLSEDANDTTIIEQKISISLNGKIKIKSTTYCESKDKEKTTTKRFKINTSKANYILHMIAEYFLDKGNHPLKDDTGSWELQLTNKNGNTKKFVGSLFPHSFDLYTLCFLVKEQLSRADLLLFDGMANKDRLNRVAIEYTRNASFIRDQDEEKNDKPLRYDYLETLVLDRESETLVMTQNIKNNFDIVRKYKVDSSIDELLSIFNADDLFKTISEKDVEVILDDENEKINYKISLNYVFNAPKIIEGRFDKRGLPDDYKFFAEKIFEFLKFYGLGEILHPKNYMKILRSPSDLTVGTVVFSDSDTKYSYLLEDEQIKKLDIVLVPSAEDGTPKVALVDNIEYIPEDKLPMPKEQMQYIIAKVSEKKEDPNEDNLEPKANDKTFD